MNEEVTLERISDKIGVYISKTHRFGTDSVLLADFCSPKKNDIAIDLGTGCGIIPLRWLSSLNPPAAVSGIEISPAVCELAQRSSKEFTNGAFRVYNADMRGFSLPKGQPLATLVCCNPPYFKPQSGVQRAGEAKTARCETECTIFDAAACADTLLKFGGRLCVCHRPERLADVFEAFRRNHIEPKRLQLVSAGKNDRVFLALVEGKKGGRPGLCVLPQMKL